MEAAEGSRLSRVVGMVVDGGLGCRGQLPSSLSPSPLCSCSAPPLQSMRSRHPTVHHRSVRRWPRSWQSCRCDSFNLSTQHRHHHLRVHHLLQPTSMVSPSPCSFSITPPVFISVPACPSLPSVPFILRQLQVPCRVVDLDRTCNDRSCHPPPPCVRVAVSLRCCCC